jgi:hypothetical protein
MYEKTLRCAQAPIRLYGFAADAGSASKPTKQRSAVPLRDDAPGSLLPPTACRAHRPPVHSVHSFTSRTHPADLGGGQAGTQN